MNNQILSAETLGVPTKETKVSETSAPEIEYINFGKYPHHAEAVADLRAFILHASAAGTAETAAEIARIARRSRLSVDVINRIHRTARMTFQESRTLRHFTETERRRLGEEDHLVPLPTSREIKMMAQEEKDEKKNSSARAGAPLPSELLSSVSGRFFRRFGSRLRSGDDSGEIVFLYFCPRARLELVFKTGLKIPRKSTDLSGHPCLELVRDAEIFVLDAQSGQRIDLFTTIFSWGNAPAGEVLSEIEDRLAELLAEVHHRPRCTRHVDRRGNPESMELVTLSQTPRRQFWSCPMCRKTARHRHYGRRSLGIRLTSENYSKKMRYLKDMIAAAADGYAPLPSQAGRSAD